MTLNDIYQTSQIKSARKGQRYATIEEMVNLENVIWVLKVLLKSKLPSLYVQDVLLKRVLKYINYSMLF